MALLDDLFNGNAGMNPLDQIRNGLLGDIITKMKSGDPMAGAVGTDTILKAMPEGQAAPAPIMQGWEASVKPAAAPLQVDVGPAPAAPVAMAAAPVPAREPAFAPGFGERMIAFGKALQGQDPGDPVRSAAVRNQTFDFLTKRGMSPDDAKALVSNPALLQSALPSIFGGRQKMEVQEIYDAQGRKQKVLLNPQNGQYQPIGGALSHTADVKAPAGYEWTDPTDHSKGVKAIEGGPATKIGAEMAGKIALMDASQKGIAETRDALLKPWGALGSGQALAASVPFVGDISLLSGDIGIAKRNVKAGIEAALRVMTGAAAPEQEVVRYMEMFMPGVKDTRESAEQKLGLLDQFMNNARRIVTQGRTSEAPGAGQGGANPPGGKPDKATAISEARKAIAAGKDPDAVRARLQQWGFDLE